LRVLLGDTAEIEGFSDVSQAYAAEGLTADTRAKLAAILALAEEFTAARLRKRESMTSYAEVTRYLMARMADLPREQVRVLYCDTKNRLIADEVLAEGTADNCWIHRREIVRRAVVLNATGVILAHNHPSGDPSPSRADISETKDIVEALRAVDIACHDHIVVGANGCASLRSLGFM
jgi:DNA repair protein RadC